MKSNNITAIGLIILISIFSSLEVFAQPCTTLGQTPSTAFPVCGTNTFQQNTVPICRTGDLPVPGCPATDGYGDKNPFYYKFTCYVGGTLAFTITPLAANEDYDWQLYDITGRNPNDIYTDISLVVTGNWAGTYGPTGASATGFNGIRCASDPAANDPTFSKMPTLIQSHEYLLMISHFTDNQSGYNLSFNGGTAVITDPTEPHLFSASAGCDGATITLKLNKAIRCNSITTTGSDFVLSPNVVAITGATTDSCSLGFTFREVTLTLASPLPAGNYQLVAVNGTDGNTLKDNCDRLIPVNEQVPFSYAPPQPIRADSVLKPPCAPDTVVVSYPKKIKCSTITSSGTDFSVIGPTPVTVTGAYGLNCVNDLTDKVVVKFSIPIFTKGTYTLLVSPGVDGSPVFDLCGQPILPEALTFTIADTVNADFSYTGAYGCLRDTLTFLHDGAHDVNSWNWTFNNGPVITTQSHTIVFEAISTNTIQLIVSNGVCKDTSTSTISLNNEVRASFTMDSIICPEDQLIVTNTSTGQIDSWLWKYDVVSTSNLKDPPPFLFPALNREAYYTVKLIVTNNLLGCSDSASNRITVLDHCFIDVPTAFTPNNDGLNDTFGPHNALKADNYEFKVYNRWGQLVFHSNNWREKWDGKINGAVQTTGVFVWMLRYTNRDTQQPVFRKGTVTVIR
ncbi:MAG TPA: gliding motility-associated C-terminal domain-containing protein [Chitinophagaceae bacterium]|nr:gliding motility-associated C-terminal domain-containing protein [Chitinophagaceae bacterium]